MKIMFKTIGIRTISATLVSLSMLAGAFVASPVVTAFAKNYPGDFPTIRESRWEAAQNKAATGGYVVLPYLFLTSSQIDKGEGRHVVGVNLP